MRTKVIIIYEHKLRELENCVLLKIELQRRGIKTKIFNNRSAIRKFYRPLIIVAPHIYDNNQLNYFSCFTKSRFLSLQVEQILFEDQEEIEYHNPKENARNAMHVAWGQEQYERYINGGIEPQDIYITGSIANYFNYIANRLYDKGENFKVYGLNRNIRTILIASNFCYTHLSDSELKRLSPKLGDQLILTKKKTYTAVCILIEWIEKLLSENHEIQIIYRPHPAEKILSDVENLAIKFENFKIITDKSIREWTYCTDKMLVYYSTCVLDAYYQKKPIGIFSPIAYDDGYSMRLLQGARNLVSTYDDFSQFCLLDFESKLDDEYIEFVYYKGDLAYKNICDVVEDNLYSEGYLVPFKRNFSNIIKNMVLDIVFDITCYIDISYITKKIPETILRNSALDEVKELRKTEKLLEAKIGRVVDDE